MSESHERLIVTPEAERPGTFTARLESSGEEIVGSTRQPLVDGARALLELGFDPATPLTMRAEGKAYDSFQPMPIGQWAKVTYTEGERTALKSLPWRPVPAAAWGQKLGCTMSDKSSDITAPRRWRVEMADKTTRTIEARSFRIEGGALILNLLAGCAAAYAPGIWLTVEGGQVKNKARDADGGNGNDGLVRMVPHAAVTEAHEPCFAPPALPPCRTCMSEIAANRTYRGHSKIDAIDPQQTWSSDRHGCVRRVDIDPCHHRAATALSKARYQSCGARSAWGSPATSQASRPPRNQYTCL